MSEVPDSKDDDLDETAYLLRSPANASRIMESVHDLNAGRCVEHELIDQD